MALRPQAVEPPRSQMACLGRSPIPKGRGTRSRQTAWAASPILLRRGTKATRSWSVVVLNPGTGTSSAPQIPQIPLHSLWSPRTGCPRAVHRWEDASRADASRPSHRVPGLRSLRGRPLPSPEPAGAGVEAGSRSFVFVSRKDSDYRSALRACSPGTRSAHYPELLKEISSQETFQFSGPS